MTQRLVRPLSLVFAAVLTAGAVAAGINWMGSRSDPDRPPAQPSVDLIAALHRVIIQPSELAKAEAEAVRDCLQQRQFDPPLPQLFTNGTANLPTFLDEFSAQAKGYGPIHDGAFNAYVSGLSKERRAALDLALTDTRSPQESFTTPNGWAVGSYRGGCFADARRLVYGTLADWLLVYALPQDLNSTAAETLTDPTVVVVMDHYRECMHGQGYEARFPQDAELLARAAGPTEQIEPRNRRIAAADAHCQAETGVRTAFLAALDRRCAEWLATNGPLVTRASDIIRIALTRVQAA
jgi:hypothetical protein